MLPELELHESVLWERHDVSIKLNATDGTTVRAADCQLRLSNRAIAISTPTQDGVTYRVQGRGDRSFHNARFSLASAKPHRLIQPWFGPYKWETVIAGPLSPMLEPSNTTWTLTVTFNSGGVFEFRNSFLKAFNDASQAASVGIDEVLPAYEA